MRRGRGGRVPLPTRAEMREAVEQDREVVACSGVKDGPQIFLKVAFHNGDISTVYLGPTGSLRLLMALKALVPDGPIISASQTTKTETGFTVQEGHMSA
jgi:hypothetical protein